MIAVFLGNKLISCDTILPVMMEVKARNPAERIRFFCFDWATYDAIRRNIVLADNIDRIGRLVCLQRRGRGLVASTLHKFRVGGILVGLALAGLSGRARFIHFKALDHGVLRLLYLVNRRRTWLFESDPCGFSPVIDQIHYLGRARPNSPKRTPAASVFVGFSREWPVLQTARAKNAEVHVLAPPRRYPGWLDTVRRTGADYIDAEFRGVGLEPPDRLVVFILGFLGPFRFLPADTTAGTLFSETMEILDEIAGPVPVVLKPHAITDMAVVSREIARYPAGRVLVSHLHPSVLATRAACFICNYYSTAMADGMYHGVPTIEYSEYTANALGVTAGGSMRPEIISHFIQRDTGALRSLLSEMLREDHRRPAMPATDCDSGGLISRLAS